MGYAIAYTPWAKWMAQGMSVAPIRCSNGYGVLLIDPARQKAKSIWPSGEVVEEDPLWRILFDKRVRRPVLWHGHMPLPHKARRLLGETLSVDAGWRPWCDGALQEPVANRLLGALAAQGIKRFTIGYKYVADQAVVVLEGKA